MARLLSFYTDKVLSGKEKVEDHEINSRLVEVAHLFSYFQDKNSFAEYVRKGLCKRLLGSDKDFNKAHEQTDLHLQAEGALRQQLHALLARHVCQD